MGRAFRIGTAMLTALAFFVSPAIADGPDPVAELDMRDANLVFHEAIKQNPKTFGPYTEQTPGSEGSSGERTTTPIKVSACFLRYTRGLTGWWCPILLRHEEISLPPGVKEPVRECGEQSALWKISELLPRPNSAAASIGVYAKVKLRKKTRKFFLVGGGRHPGYPPGFPSYQHCP
jgi:hypothetical protein